MESMKLGIQFFNETWDLIDKVDKTPEDNAMMIDKAHTSSLFWRLSSQCKPVNIARSQWQLSRVYALVNMGDSALYHAQNSLDVCTQNDIKGFDAAFAYEAVARALMVQKRHDKCAEYKQRAEAACADIEKQEDKDYALAEIASITC